MTPQAATAAYKRALGACESIAVRRYSGTGPSRSPSDTLTMARVMGYQPHEIVGAVVQGDRRVIALVETLSGVLRLTTDDKLVIRGVEVAIKAVDDNTRRVAGTLIALEIQVAG